MRGERTNERQETRLPSPRSIAESRFRFSSLETRWQRTLTLSFNSAVGPSCCYVRGDESVRKSSRYASRSTYRPLIPKNDDCVIRPIRMNFCFRTMTTEDPKRGGQLLDKSYHLSIPNRTWSHVAQSHITSSITFIESAESYKSNKSATIPTW